jgi:hypothetical protein
VSFDSLIRLILLISQTRRFDFLCRRFTSQTPENLNETGVHRKSDEVFENPPEVFETPFKRSRPRRRSCGCVL